MFVLLSPQRPILQMLDVVQPGRQDGPTARPIHSLKFLSPINEAPLVGLVWYIHTPMQCMGPEGCVRNMCVLYLKNLQVVAGRTCQEEPFLRKRHCWPSYQQ